MAMEVEERFRSYENSRSKKASSIGQKSGFGSAGARSSAS